MQSSNLKCQSLWHSTTLISTLLISLNKTITSYPTQQWPQYYDFIRQLHNRLPSTADGRNRTMLTETLILEVFSTTNTFHINTLLPQPSMKFEAFVRIVPVSIGQHPNTFDMHDTKWHNLIGMKYHPLILKYMRIISLSKISDFANLLHVAVIWLTPNNSAQYNSGTRVLKSFHNVRSTVYS